MSRSVQIEVLDEEEYALEVQREREAQSERRAVERERARKAAALDQTRDTTVAPPPPAAAATLTSASARPADAASHEWSALVVSLALPSFFHTLHDTRVYDPAAYQSLRERDIPAFHRSALDALARMREIELAHQLVGAHRSRRELVSTLRACLAFLVPPVPNTPAMTEEDEQAAANTDAAGPFEMAWQTDALSESAARLVDAMAAREEAGEGTADVPRAEALDASLPALPSPVATALMRSSRVRRLLARVLPEQVAFLRGEMRAGPVDAHTAAWKAAERFPSPFLAGALICLAPATALAAHAADLLPLLLPLVDDHEMRFKLAGLASLQRLLQCVPGSAYPSGAGLLLLQSLKTCLSFRERAVVALAVPAYVQAYMVFFPAVTALDDDMLEALAVAQGLREAKNARDQPVAGTPLAAALTPAGASVDLRDRVAAHTQLLGTLVQEATFFTLSPSTDNAFALFVHAQTLLPALLYVGPIAILTQLHALISMLTTWCIFTDAHHARARSFAWQAIEAMLEMRVVEKRLARHAGKLVETVSRAWIQGVAARDTSRRFDQAALTQNAHPDAGTIVRILRRLRILEPTRVEQIWREIATMPDLASLDQALRDHM